MNEQDIAGTLHFLALEALLSSRSWRPHELAFQGGTSLHLMRRSPRISEDLDFLVALGDDEIARVMEATCRKVRAMAVLEWPQAEIECKSRIPDPLENRLASMTLKCGHPQVPRKIGVRIEMLRLSAEQLSHYAAEPLALQAPSTLRASIAAIVNTGTLASIYVDKITALPLRPYLKYRDVFDLWWIRQQPAAGLPSGHKLAAALEDNLAVYRTSPDEWLRRCDGLLGEAFGMPETTGRAATDLARFLPPRTLQQIRDLVGFGELIAAARDALGDAAKALRKR